ncbi:MAG TPA: Rid family hydrolase [Bacillota bacterium]|nr:MAG: Enamine/imine deaminase [Firmicutes bacterium ADurb.Bin153]HNV35195.1 Rid family hydrolase [Bacillota bacterium]HPU96190.1 Rid family hydrolase [Bacillota bacterium]
MRKIQVKDVPEPKGHYTPAIESGGLVFASGMLPVDLGTGAPIMGSFEEQLEVLFFNLGALLKSAGCTKDDVVKITAYISDIALWARFNAAYSAFFEGHKPARTVVPLGGKLHYGLDVEIEFVAERR